MSYIYTHGSGTVEDPYQIWTAADLNGVRDHTDKYFIQMADVDLTSYNNWVPIGNAQRRFQGHYDGNNFTISNLTVTDRDCYGGLFGQLYGACSVANVTLKNISVSCGYETGGIAGYSYGWIDSTCTIENCHILSGQINGIVVGNYKGDYIGGIAGRTWGETVITRCSVNCNISGRYYIGGLIGASYYTLLEKSFALGSVNSEDTVYGGYGCGGLIGYLVTDTNIENCYARNSIVGEWSVGGLVGDLSDCDTTFLNCYFAGTIIGTEGDVGGAIGYSSGYYQIINCYYNSETTGLSGDNYGALPRTTAEMTYPYDTSVNQTYVGWDFGTTWHHDKNLTINEGYPHFKKLVYKILIPITGGIVTYL
jgi:hypothetical protein